MDDNFDDLEDFDPEDEEDIPEDEDGAQPLVGRSFAADLIHLYADEDHKEICAIIGPNPVGGIAGFGASTCEALQDLADALLRERVWIEVNAIWGKKH